MFEHAIRLLREQAPTLTHEGRRDALEAVEVLEGWAEFIGALEEGMNKVRVPLDKQ